MVAKSFLTHHGVYILEGYRLLEEIFRCIDVGDIWGIGQKYTAMLESFGIRNALESIFQEGCDYKKSGV